MSKHRYVRVNTIARPEAADCTFEVNYANATLFWECCGRHAVKACFQRHGGPSFQQCGEARCRKHLGKRNARGKQMKVFTNDFETVIAADLVDARLVWHEHVGGDVEDFDENAESTPWREMAGDELLRIRCDDDGDPTEDTDAEVIEKTAAEWATRGRSYLCIDA